MPSGVNEKLADLKAATLPPQEMLKATGVVVPTDEVPAPPTPPLVKNNQDPVWQAKQRLREWGATPLYTPEKFMRDNRNTILVSTAVITAAGMLIATGPIFRGIAKTVAVWGTRAAITRYLAHAMPIKHDGR